jgi:hypothetical protein
MYISGEKFYDYYYGETHYIRPKLPGEVAHSEILLPPEAPPEFEKRWVLWNYAELRETKRNARLAFDLKGNLPPELSLEVQIKLVREFLVENFIKRGLCVDYAIHDKGDGKPHCHILVTTRQVTCEGLGDKCRELYQKEALRELRRSFAEHINRELERGGFKCRVNHESFKMQDINCKVKRVAKKNEHKAVIEMEERGIQTDCRAENVAIEEHNRIMFLELELKRNRKKSRGLEL